MSKASKIILLLYFPLLGILIAALNGFSFPMWLPYSWLKTFHVLGVVLLIGNMIVAPVWISIAVQKREQNLMKYAFRLLRITDLSFTMPGIFLIVLTGVFMLPHWNGIYGQDWIFQSVILLFVMWAISFPVLFCQEKLYQLVEKYPLDERAFSQWLLIWSWTGTAVMIPPFIILYLMVAKVGFW